MTQSDTNPERPWGVWIFSFAMVALVVFLAYKFWPESDREESPDPAHRLGEELVQKQPEDPRRPVHDHKTVGTPAEKIRPTIS